MSDQPPLDPEAVFRRAMEAGREVKFGMGVSAKTTRGMLALIGVWAIIVFRLSPNLVMDGALIGAGLIATAVFIWWARSTQSFAQRNPAQAMLDGAQFLEYQKFEASIKGGSDPDRLKDQAELPRLTP